jgi:anthranilate phosphoribosyltransferase
LPQATLDDLKGGDAALNAGALRAMLEGEAGPFRDVVVYGSAAALVVAGKAGDLREGAILAAESIDSGRARGVLEQLVAITNQPAPSDT